MRTALVHAVRQQFGFRCGYCGISEDDAGTTLTVDHFQPRSQGGRDELVNLVYCCHACNEHKGDYWNPNSSERILHPGIDNLQDHYSEQTDGTLMPFTEAGRFHITRLQLNRPALVRHRQTLREEQDIYQERQLVVESLNRIDTMLVELKTVLDGLRSGGE